MIDWITKLEDFLRAAGKSILEDAGGVSRVKAIAKAKEESMKYKSGQAKTYISDFDRYIKELGKHK